MERNVKQDNTLEPIVSVANPVTFVSYPEDILLPASVWNTFLLRAVIACPVPNLECPFLDHQAIISLLPDRITSLPLYPGDGLDLPRDKWHVCHLNTGIENNFISKEVLSHRPCRLPGYEAGVRRTIGSVKVPHVHPSEGTSVHLTNRDGDALVVDFFVVDSATDQSLAKIVSY